LARGQTNESSGGSFHSVAHFFAIVTFSCVTHSAIWRDKFTIEMAEVIFRTL
jgi:hypothetical protein